MGFLDNLLKKETRKIISGVVDSIADNVVAGAKGALDKSGISSAVENRMQPTADRAGKVIAAADAESGCGGSAAVVRKRIENCLQQDFPGYSLREEVPISDIGVQDILWTYSYGVYRDGVAVAMINLLSGANDYKKKIVLQSKAACENAGIGYVHFLLRLPNRTAYISEQLHKIISA